MITNDSDYSDYDQFLLHLLLSTVVWGKICQTLTSVASVLQSATNLKHGYINQ